MWGLRGGKNGDFEATAFGAGTGEVDLGTDLAGEGAADCQAQAEAFAAVAFIVADLVELIE